MPLIEEDATGPLLQDYTIDERLFPGPGRMMCTFKLSHQRSGFAIVLGQSVCRAEKLGDDEEEQQQETTDKLIENKLFIVCRMTAQVLINSGV